MKRDKTEGNPLHVVYRDISDIKPYPRNPRKHTGGQIAKIAKSIKEFGWTNPILIDKDGTVIAGHARLEAARLLGMRKVPTIALEDLTPDQVRAYIIADNQLALDATWDEELLTLELSELKGLAVDLSLTGFDRGEIERLLAQEVELMPEISPRQTHLSDRWVFPPFSVLDGRSGPWLERKSLWKRLGIRSEVGRADGLCYNVLVPTLRLGTSVFDPVLTELVVRWYSPPGGKILDPFAGGSVRGVVAGALGRHYTGVDLSRKQVEANREQWQTIARVLADGRWIRELSPPDAEGPYDDEGYSPIEPQWIVGDSAKLDRLVNGPFDLVFTCPPYGDLERYSDDPRDLSTMQYEKFLEAYAHIINLAYGLLRDHRFLVWVVGEFRVSHGVLRGFVDDTIAAFKRAGAKYYDHAVFITPAGSAAIRAGQFAVARKLVRTHQHVLVFVKGDPRRATMALTPKSEAGKE